MSITDEDLPRLKTFCLLSSKPVIFACNVAESDLSDPSCNPFVAKVQNYTKESHHAGCCVICSKLEEELSELNDSEIEDFLKDLGVEDSGVSQLIQATYDLLGLASFLTAGEKEVRAWTFKKGMKAPQCAGVIHTDFEKGFIKADVVTYKELTAAGSNMKAREAGKYRVEGKDYEVQDGDVILFKVST